jgi:NAD(P)-dependent dehydrogenase (short-subunit alcohol dehydrogenase family)
MNLRSVVITGATSGLGRATAEIVAKSPYHQVVVAGRNTQRTRAELWKIAVHPVIVLPLELESLASVRGFAGALASSRAAPLGALVCNAGVQDVDGLKRTVDGFERTFAVNHLAHFALANLLLPMLGAGGRIVVVSSNTHDPKTRTGLPAPRFSDARALAEGVDYGPDPVRAGRIRYTTSKLCNVLFARALARRLAGSSDERLRTLRVAAFDPGMMPGTGLARSYGPLSRFAWSYLLPLMTLTTKNVNTVRTSAARLATLVLDPRPPWTTGAYVSGGVEATPSDEALDDARAEELWDGSLALLEQRAR